jgi:hypothetical protein
VVTRWGMVTRESESFGARVSACERKPGGCTRTSTALARNRERWGRRRDSANLGKKATNAKRRGHRLSAFLGNSCVRFARYRTVQLPERNPLRYAARGEIGSANAGWLHWKEVNKALPDGLSLGSPGHLGSKEAGGQQYGNKAEHPRPRGSSARLSTGKATPLELQSAGARFAPRE